MIFQDCPVKTGLKNLIFKLVSTVKNLFFEFCFGTEAKKLILLPFLVVIRFGFAFSASKKKQRFFLFMGFALVETKYKKTANILLI